MSPCYGRTGALTNKEWTMDTELQAPNLFNVPEAARRLGISAWTLRKHIARKSVAVTRIGRRVLVSDEEVRRIKLNGLPSLRTAQKTRGGPWRVVGPPLGCEWTFQFHRRTH